MVFSMCSKQKGKHSPHPAIQDWKPVIKIDLAFLSTKEHPGASVTVFTPIDVRTQIGMAAIVHSKSVNIYGLTELKRFIYEKRTQAIR